MRYRYGLLFLLIGIMAVFAQQQRNYETDGAITEAPDAWYAGAGLGALNNLDADDPAYQFYGGKLWHWNAITALKAVAEGAFDFAGSWLVSSGVGANFYPIRTRYTPYIGGNIGVGYARRDFNNDDLVGLDLGGVFGVLLYRGAPVEVNVETSANWVFREGEGDDFPATFTARVGVHF